MIWFAREKLALTKNQGAAVWDRYLIPENPQRAEVEADNQKITSLKNFNDRAG